MKPRFAIYLILSASCFYKHSRAKCNSSQVRQINDTSNLFTDFLHNKLQSFSNCCVMSCTALKSDEADMFQVV